MDPRGALLFVLLLGATPRSARIRPFHGRPEGGRGLLGALLLGDLGFPKGVASLKIVCAKRH